MSSVFETPGLMRHQHEGDPWGPCRKCRHPAYDPIHFLDKEDEDAWLADQQREPT